MENVRDTFKEVAAAILPVTIVVILLQVVFIKMPFEAVIQFLVGVLFVSIGFFLFLIGVNAGLLPIGEMIGRRLPSTKKAGFIIATGFLLGIAVTVAELADTGAVAHAAGAGRADVILRAHDAAAAPRRRGRARERGARHDHRERGGTARHRRARRGQQAGGHRHARGRHRRGQAPMPADPRRRRRRVPDHGCALSPARRDHPPRRRRLGSRSRRRPGRG